MKKNIVLLIACLLINGFAISQGKYLLPVLQNKGIKNHHQYERLHNLTKQTRGTIHAQLDSMVEVGYNKTVYTYDANGNCTLQIQYNRDNNQWINNYKEEYSYDVNNNLILENVYTWVDTISQWVPQYMYHMYYNAVNNDTLETESMWNDISSSWDLTEKDEYAYDAGNNMFREVDYFWDAANSLWNNAYMYTYFYDANNNDTLDMGYIWQNTNWANNYMDQYKYDIHNNQILELDYGWNDTLSQWFYTDKYEYGFDANNNQTTEISSSWDGTQWVYSMKEEYTYNLNVTANDLTAPYFMKKHFTIFFHNIPMSVKYYEWDNNQWVGGSMNYWYYSGLPSSISLPVQPDKNIIIYPNPVKDKIFISFSLTKKERIEAKLVNEVGKTIIVFGVNEFDAGKHTIELNNLNIASGLYFYTMKYGNFYETKEILIK